jgi:hypothetical protein
MEPAGAIPETLPPEFTPANVLGARTTGAGDECGAMANGRALLLGAP